MKQSQLRRLIRNILAEQRIPHSGGQASHTMGPSGGGTSLPPQAEACQAIDIIIKGGGSGRGKFVQWLKNLFKCKNPDHNHGGGASADFDDSGDWIDGYNPGGGGL
tara:strand:+ start:1092 stop:1409 length:318 start_codon:yes stop_codon:yes gene_type:complete